jgi:hypothetical protein
MQLASFPVASLVHDRHATREGLLVEPRGDFLSLDRISLESADCVPLALYLDTYGRDSVTPNELPTLCCSSHLSRSSLAYKNARPFL